MMTAFDHLPEVQCSFDHLPVEIIAEILSYLPQRSFEATQCASKLFHVFSEKGLIRRRGLTKSAVLRAGILRFLKHFEVVPEDLSTMIYYGHLHLVKYYFPRLEPPDTLFTDAIRAKHLEILKYLYFVEYKGKYHEFTLFSHEHLPSLRWYFSIRDRVNVPPFLLEGIIWRDVREFLISRRALNSSYGTSGHWRWS